LRTDPTSWPMPTATAACSVAECGEPMNTGRFCLRCGAMVRRGRDRRWLGPAFGALQRVLRDVRRETPDRVVTCACGAIAPIGAIACGKCGERLSSGRHV